MPPTVGAPASANASQTAGGADDSIDTSAGRLTVHPVNHATFYLDGSGKTIWLDPTSEKPLEEPKADLILITHTHPDHLDPKAVARLKKPTTRVIGPRAVADQLSGVEAMANGEHKDLGFVGIDAVPAYNLVRGPAPGKLFHEKGAGNGYVLSIGGKRLYVSGDTECTPEMKGLKAIDVAFVCMNLPYTMPPSEAAACVREFHPRVLYPYHYRGSNLDELTSALSGSGVEVRSRNWY